MTDTRELKELTIHTQADLHRMWQLLMRPLGFSGRSIWLSFVDPDRRPVPSLVEIAECDDLPSDRETDALFEMLATVLRDAGPEMSVALLVTRPGHLGTNDDDRALGRRLVEGARRAGVPLEPLHVADDASVRALAPDDLAA